DEVGEVEGEEARDDRLEVGEAAAGRVVVAQWWNRRRRLEPEPSGVVDLGAGVRGRGASVLDVSVSKLEGVPRVHDRDDELRCHGTEVVREPLARDRKEECVEPFVLAGEAKTGR